LAGSAFFVAAFLAGAFSADLTGADLTGADFFAGAFAGALGDAFAGDFLAAVLPLFPADVGTEVPSMKRPGGYAGRHIVIRPPPL
jgi:hypothetical protein